MKRKSKQSEKNCVGRKHCGEPTRNEKNEIK